MTTSLAPAVPTPSRHRSGDRRAVLGHHLLAAAVVTVPFAVGAPLMAPAVPPVATLLVVVLVGLAPVGGWLLHRSLRREGVRGAAAVRRRLGLARPTRREVLRHGLPALLAALALPGLVVGLEPWTRAVTGVPDGWSTGWPAGQGAAATAATAALWLVAAVVIGPLVEELLFRGLLQPLVASTPARRILLGSALFTVYHLWQPWAWPAVLLATLPLAWVRERTGSTVLALGVHVVTNAVTWALLVSSAMQR